MTTLHLIRHGEAAASWQQNPDPGLSEQGRGQAVSLVPDLSLQPLDHLVSSPLRRAQETAAPLAAARQLPVIIERAFREIPTPPLIALENRLAWLKSCAHQTGGEADPVVLEWRDDILQALQSLDGQVVIFTHFMVMNMVLGHLRGVDQLVCYQPDYCSILSLQKTGTRLQLLNVGRQALRPVL